MRLKLNLIKTTTRFLFVSINNYSISVNLKLERIFLCLPYFVISPGLLLFILYKKSDKEADGLNLNDPVADKSLELNSQAHQVSFTSQLFILLALRQCKK